MWHEKLGPRWLKDEGDVSMTREAQASPSALAAVRQTIIEGYIQQDRSELCQRL